MRQMRISKTQAEKFADSLNWEKGSGLVAAIAQGRSKEVLMLAYMNREALTKTLMTGKMYYYSRSKQRLWRKGETSGNEQMLLSYAADCDRDAILFQVDQKGPACHRNTRTCFVESEELIFTLDELYGVILDRKLNPKKGSYTCKLLRNRKKIVEKMEEESGELVRAFQKEGKQRTIEEASDLLYHLLVLLAAENISLADIYKELAKRHKR